MASAAELFLKNAEAKTFDAEHKRKLLFNIGQYDKKVIVGKQQYSDLPLARKKSICHKEQGYREHGEIPDRV